MVLKAFVTEANYTDREVASWLIPGLPTRFPRLRKLWADGIYRGAEFIDEMRERTGITVEIVERDPSVNGFKLLPYRFCGGAYFRLAIWLSPFQPRLRIPSPNQRCDDLRGNGTSHVTSSCS
jgi:hypothetical protein